VSEVEYYLIRRNIEAVGAALVLLCVLGYILFSDFAGAKMVSEKQVRGQVVKVVPPQKGATFSLYPVEVRLPDGQVVRMSASGEPLYQVGTSVAVNIQTYDDDSQTFMLVRDSF
jgi:hypothetical protein